LTLIRGGKYLFIRGVKETGERCGQVRIQTRRKKGLTRSRGSIFRLKKGSEGSKSLAVSSQEPSGPGGRGGLKRGVSQQLTGAVLNSRSSLGPILVASGDSKRLFGAGGKRAQKGKITQLSGLNKLSCSGENLLQTTLYLAAREKSENGGESL